jgi:hypothetical protein
MNHILSFWRNFSLPTRLKIIGTIVSLYVVALPVLVVSQWSDKGTLRALQDKNLGLQEKVESLTQEIGKFTEDGSSTVVTQELRALREEVIKYRAEQRGRDQVLGITQPGMTVSDPLDSLSQSLMTLEQITGTGSAQTETPEVPSNGAHLGTVTLLDDKGWSSVDAFETPSSSAKSIGQLVIHVSYPFFEKKNGWYQVELASGKKGWVQAQYIREE